MKPTFASPPTRRVWDREFKACLGWMIDKHPIDLHARTRACRTYTLAKLGPRPPSFLSILIKTLIGYQKAGGDSMDFSWTKNLWKSMRSALLAGVVLFVANFLGAFDSAAELQAAGMPAWIAPIAAMGIAAAATSFRNFLKVKKRINLP